MKHVYVAHPFRGKTGGPDEVKRNVESATLICRKISQANPDILIFSPIHAFSFMTVSDPQERVLNQCVEMVKTVDEVWVYGDRRNSEGCMMEISAAKEAGVPVLFREAEDVQSVQVEKGRG